jgi:threonine dehydrogenase-like Zn-dependent dehydrogenase
LKAAIFHGKGKIEIEERPYPKIQESTDVVVRVVRACVCGSDLWYYRGINEREVGSPIGHEFIGVVEEVGDKVSSLQTGDLVIAPFLYCDNNCPHCQIGMTANCVNSGGWGKDTGGGQGEAVRVPLADGTLVKVPKEGLSEELLLSLLTLTDVMCTGHHAAVSAGVKAGDSVVVIGDGAVGLCAVIAAKRLGARRIIAMSRHANRQKLAKEFGATDIVEVRGDEAVAAVMKITDSIGADATLECVGSNESVLTAIGVARPGSTIGAVGLPTGVELPFRKMFFKNVGIKGGPAPARAYIPELLEDVMSGAIQPGKVFDLTTDLDGIKEAYAAMDERRAIKSLLLVDVFEVNAGV